ncbi:MAG: hypothetical protein PGN13_06060 [Patulibacter minatonensis]
MLRFTGETADQEGVVVAPFPLAAMRVSAARGPAVPHDPILTLASLERAQSLRLTP